MRKAKWYMWTMCQEDLRAVVCACGVNNTDTQKRFMLLLTMTFSRERKLSCFKIGGHYQREDMQPDVIATTKDNQQYIIEFTFDYKVQHKQAIDYNNLNCLTPL